MTTLQASYATHTTLKLENHTLDMLELQLLKTKSRSTVLE